MREREKRERAAVGGIRGDVDHARRSGDTQRNTWDEEKEREGTAIDFGVGRRNAGKDFGWEQILKRLELGDEKVLKIIFITRFVLVDFWDVTNLPHLK